MTTESEFTIWGVTAGQDLSVASTKHKVVTVGGTIAGTLSQAIGILRSSSPTGSQASVVIRGITKAVAATAITTPGYPLTVTGSGFLAACASGGGHIGRYLGTAACASGDLIPVAVDFTQVAAWAGV